MMEEEHSAPDKTHPTRCRKHVDTGSADTLGGLGMFVFLGLERIKSISVNFNGENWLDIQAD